jgi:NAD(P)-dependent dehydrogenase (short-subunit alcohol dehydrogenase family)
MDLELKGKLALVSGSTAGIGLAIATTLALEAARVIVNGRSQASVDEVVTRLQSATGGSVQGFAGDLSQAASAEEIARQQEVASLVAYIASPLASATTGAALRVDGGVIKSVF